MATTTSLKESLLERAWAAAKAANPEEPDLRAQLLSEVLKATNALVGGSLASITTNGRETVFAKPDAHNLSQDDIREAHQTLLKSYDRIKARDELDDDEDVFEAIKAELVPATDVYSDFSLGRC